MIKSLCSQLERRAEARLAAIGRKLYRQKGSKADRTGWMYRRRQGWKDGKLYLTTVREGGHGWDKLREGGTDKEGAMDGGRP